MNVNGSRFSLARSVREKVCRSCGSDTLKPFLDLGVMPFADRLIDASELSAPEPAAALEVAFCETCTLVQIRDTVHPEDLFDSAYPYYSSFSPYLLDHSRKNVLDLIERRRLSSEGFVIELASNDGYLLKNYVKHGVRVLGIDPADGPVAAARKIGVDTMHAFFSASLADDIVAEHGRADIVHGNNVLAHVADTNGFVSGIAKLIKDDGVVVIEAPYVRDLIEHSEFDTIYHEHLCYFSVTAVDHLFRRHGLFLNDVRRLPIHGGSLRFYFEPHENVGASVRALLREENKLGINTFSFYEKFSTRVAAIGDELHAMLRRLKLDGAKIAAYGAAAKGATMINFARVNRDLVDFVVDRNIHKIGKYMPGKHLPIRPVEALLEEQPDYALLLAWNFADEILEQQAEFRRRGGRFIVPVPEPRII
jgi:SAM-dependent methyltransferase